MELRNNNTTIIHHVIHWITAFADEKNAIAKKQNSFPVLIHHEKIKLAGARGLGRDPRATRSPLP